MPPNIDIADQGCREAKKVEKNWFRKYHRKNTLLQFHLASWIDILTDVLDPRGLMSMTVSF